MLRILYNVLWYPALPIALVAAGARGKQDRRERMGKLDLPQNGAGTRIWIHAASVGEIEAVRPVAAGLLRTFEGAKIVITTMTATGRDAARRRIAGAAACVLAPLDCPALVRRFVRRLRPDLVIIGETELWPNFFVEAHRAGARVAVINGRISERSLGRYRRARKLFAHALTAADLILVQTSEDGARYLALGARADRIIVTGNTKFDFPSEIREARLRPLLENFAAGRMILVAGSTSRGEEAVILDAWLKLREQFPGLALVIAPRHPARAPEVEELMRAASVSYLRASGAEDPNADDVPVLLLDTMGELQGLYRRATVAFVGGSMFAGRGGQNVAEPAAVSVPVLFGPYHENQRTMASALIAAEAGGIVSNADEFIEACARWLRDESARVEAGARGRAAAEKAGGGVRDTLHHLRQLVLSASP